MGSQMKATFALMGLTLVSLGTKLGQIMDGHPGIFTSVAACFTVVAACHSIYRKEKGK